jgi:hypothetical protein
VRLLTCHWQVLGMAWCGAGDAGAAAMGAMFKTNQVDRGFSKLVSQFVYLCNLCGCMLSLTA